jgi:hypothetical protein
MVVGGANLSVFYTANELGTAPSVGSTVLHTMKRKIKTSLTRTTFTIDQNEDNPALTSFLENYAPVTTVTADQGEYEDGTKFNSSQATSDTLLQIVYGGVDTVENKRKIVLMLCKLAQDAGAFDQESGKYTKPKVGGDVVNNDTDLVIPATYFLTTLVSGATAVTIPAKIGYKEVWFAIPTP